MSQKIFVIGGGGREHALCWKIARSPLVGSILCAPGNPGIAQIAQTRAVSPEDLSALLELAREFQPDLTIVGPDNPLALGIVDLFTANGFKTFGPNQKAAQFEASKVFTKEFCLRHHIPTARSEQFTDVTKALACSRDWPFPQVIKADGLALGKGVIIAQNAAEAEAAIDDMLVKKVFGAAGEKILIEEFLTGPEISAHAFVDGKTFAMMPIAQDHKRVGEGDTGLNTGGMGTFSPVPFASDADIAQIAEEVFERFMEGCRKENIDYRGILFPGLILTTDGPKVLEFNARFGDPETQSYMRRMESDLVEVCHACVDGTLAGQEIRWNTQTAICVVVASGGYPGNYQKNSPITGLDHASEMPGVVVFHAGTSLKDGAVINSGGRVLGVTALEDSLPAARQRAYAAVDQIHFSGAFCRRDIAAKGLV